MNRIIVIDCEGHGPAPTLNSDSEFEFGAVDFDTMQSFHGIGGTKETFDAFQKWLSNIGGNERLTFVSDNPAYDWQFINYYFHKFHGSNPFGWSARRIGDFYAGVCKDWGRATDWKRLRDTAHDHNPVHDAVGNAEALRKILKDLQP